MEIINRDKDQYQIEVKGDPEEFEKLYHPDENYALDGSKRIEPDAEFYNLRLVQLET